MCNHVNPKTNVKCKYKPNQEWCGHHNPERKRKVKDIKNDKDKEKEADVGDDEMSELCERIRGLEVAVGGLKSQILSKIKSMNFRIINTHLSVKKMHKAIKPQSLPSRMQSLDNLREGSVALESYTMAEVMNFNNSIENIKLEEAIGEAVNDSSFVSQSLPRNLSYSLSRSSLPSLLRNAWS